MNKLLLLGLTILLCCCTSKQKNTNTDGIKDTIQVFIAQDDIVESTKGLSFSELIEKVPVTPLPFGIEGLDTMLKYKPYKSYKPSLPKIWYDSLNIYKLNTYFQDNKEKAVEYFADRDYYLGDIISVDGWEERFYFSKRFPPKKSKEYLLFYTGDKYYDRDDQGKILNDQRILYDCWLLLVCNKEGVIFESHFLGKVSPTEYHLYYMDKNYNISEKYFCAPRKGILVRGYTMSDIYKVNDEVSDADSTIMYYDGGKFYVWVKNHFIEVFVGEYSYGADFICTDWETQIRRLDSINAVNNVNEEENEEENKEENDNGLPDYPEISQIAYYISDVGLSDRGESRTISSLSFEELAEFMAYLLYWGEPLVQKDEYRDYFFYFMRDCAYFAWDYDVEFKKRNYYGLKGFKELWEEAKEGGNGIRPAGYSEGGDEIIGQLVPKEQKAKNVRRAYNT